MNAAYDRLKACRAFACCRAPGARAGGLLMALLLVALIGCGPRGAGVARVGEATAWRTALPELEARAGERPEDAPAWGTLAIAYFFADRPDAADSTATRALAIDPREGQALYARALLAERAGDWDAADAIYQRRDALHADGALRALMATRHRIASREIIRQALRAELETARGAPSAAQEPHTLIVRGFRPLGGTHGDSVLAAGVTHFLTNSLAQIDTLTVIDQTRRSMLEQEIERSTTELFAPETRLVARTLGAGLSLAGRAGAFVTAAGEVIVQYELEDLVLTRGTSAYRGTDGIIEVATATEHLLDELGRQVVRVAEQNLGLALEADVRDRLARPPTASYAAFLAYAEGLLWEEQEEFGRALTHYQEAARLDPGFDWAAGGAERVAGGGRQDPPQPPPTPSAPAGGTDPALEERASELAAEQVDEMPGQGTEEPEPTLGPIREPVSIIVQPR